MGRTQRFSLLAAMVVAPVALSACAPSATLPPPLPAMQCTAAPASWAIGRAATTETVERIRVDTGSALARVIHPDDVVTMEYRSDRVNVKVNERNAIVGITCG